jgi:hypothetical protein
MARPQCDTTLVKIFTDSFTLSISLGQRGKEHKSAKKNAYFQEGEIAHTKGPGFYSFREGWGVGFLLFIFCFHCILNMFPKFPICFQ